VLQNSSENQFQTSGVVTSDNIVEISSKLMGYIEYLSLDVGDNVKQGALIARIKNQEAHKKADQISSSIEQTRISLLAFEKDYNRIKRLYDQQSATQKELDDISTAVESTKLQIKQLESSKSEVEVMKAYSEIISPISGIVTAKHKTKGEMAFPGHPLLKIQDDKNKAISLTIPESFIKAVSKGSKVQYKLETEALWKDGTLTEISHAANSGQYSAKIKLPKNNAYFSGMFTDLILDLSDNNSARHTTKILSIEKKALVKRGQLTGIFIPTDQNTALLRWVIPGKDLGDRIEILSGLSKNEKYITQSDSRLINGIPIAY
jgi:RND family efflux transporter MFP subunit